MTPETIRFINITLLSFCTLEAIIVIFSFKRELLNMRASRLFFAKIIVTAVTMFCYTISLIHNPAEGDALETFMLSIAYVGFYVICLLYIEYLKAQINHVEKDHPVPMIVSYAASVIAIVGALLWVLSIFDDNFEAWNELLSKHGSIFRLELLGILLLIAISLYLLIRYHQVLGIRQTLILSSMPLLIAAATVAEPFAYGIELRYPAVMLEFLIVYTQNHLDLEILSQKNENDEIRTRLNMTTGRIKPHYLYNVLTTIYYLCDDDPQKAQNAIGVFSEYLRNTLETMEKLELVSFSWELKEVRHYLSLEKLRFGDRLKIEYDIEHNEFLIPPLSIQPLVENAVKHGIAAKEEGGTVRIVSRKLSDGGAQIRVMDDGVGFDVSALKNQDITHEGVANVRERIRLEIGGEMTITSAPGKGTTVVVTLRPDRDPKSFRTSR